MKSLSIIYSVFFILTFSFNTGCKKAKENVQENVMEQLYEQYVLDKDFIVSYAHNGSEEITSLYDGYKFRLVKNTFYEGPLTAIKNGITYTGTWKTSDDYGKLTISMPETPVPSFGFFNREWRFIEKNLQMIKLNPWFRTDQEKTEFHITRL